MTKESETGLEERKVSMGQIKDNIEEVKQRISDACQRSGRNPEEITLIAVSKTKPVSMIEEVLETGVLEYGENKVQEIQDKYPVLPKEIRWHMIGHLQRNKVKYIIDKVSLIHSVDSVRLAEQIEEEAAKKDMAVKILLEVNVAQEESKYGFLMEEVEAAILRIKDFPHVKIVGLMTIAPFVENPQDNRKYFKKLSDLSVDIKCKNIDNVTMGVLSMGMTGDYQVAIEEGATMIRVGTGIFGTR